MGIILKYAGKDATEEFDPIHPPDTLDKYLDKSKHLGPVDMNTVVKIKEEEDPEEAERQQRIADKPLLSQCYNLMDFESVAKRVMKRSAWGYYSSAADDEIVCFHSRLGSWEIELTESTRRYEKTTKLSTGYGSGPRSWSM